MFIKDFCHRVNISDQITKQTGLIDNHNTCIVVHLKSSKKSFKLEAGASPLSMNIFQFQVDLRDIIGGISPCNTSRFCFVLNATVIRFSVMNTGLTTKAKSFDLSMAAASTFVNNGSATISQDYTVTKSIKETTETTLASSYSSMNSFNVRAGVEYEEDEGIPSICSEKIKASLSVAYTKEWTDTQNKNNTRRNETSTTFSINQKIELKPCKQNTK